MRAMKGSGIEWIGEIPADWEVSTIKREYVFQTGWTPDTTHEEYFVGENIWINISDMKSKVVYDSEKHISDEAVRLASMNISPKGSLLYAFKLSVGAVSFCGIDMYTNEAIATFLPGKNNLRFLYYTAPIFIIKNANENIYGAKLLNQKLIRNAKIVIPPLEVQKRIADYLDHKCRQIDTIIARQQEVIEKLKAYKLSVITEAVTKGLNPNVPMKDSGVEWIGEIPEHWKMVRLKFLLSHIIDCPHETPIYSADGDYLVIRTADQDLGKLRAAEDMYRLDEGEYQNRIRRMPLEKDDIVYGREGERWGLACLIPESNKYCLGQRMLQFRCKKESIFPRFAMWALNSRFVYLQGAVDTIGSTSPHVNISTVRNFLIPVPRVCSHKQRYAIIREWN
jgi:type I restriction enzyme S subunit